MKNSRFKRVNGVMCVVVVCIGSTALGFILSGKSTAIAGKTYINQAKQRSDEKVIVTFDAPGVATFGDLRVNSVNIVQNQKFSAKSIAEVTNSQSADWFQDLHFSLKNKSDKPIVYVRFELQFPDTMAQGGPLMGCRDLAIGIPPNVARLRPPEGKEPLLLDPGDRATFTLSANELQRIKDFLAHGKFDVDDINQVTVQILYIIFDDGIKWALGGFYYRPNPNAPGGYERMRP